jgi:hypothetical protein
MMKNHTLKHRLIQFAASTVTGALILFLLSFVQEGPPPQKGEYYLSSFFRNEVSWMALVLFAILAFAACYAWRWNAWITGFGFIAVLPILAIIEGTIYRGSHNLLPLELIYYAYFALPSLAAALLGAYLARRKYKESQ